MSPTTKRRRKPAPSKRTPPRRRTRTVAKTAIPMADLLAMLKHFTGIEIVSVLPKVIDVDWEDNDPTTENPVPNPVSKGLYVDDYLVWRNHTDVDLTIEFTSDWPFSGTLEDISVPAGSDSSAYKVVDPKGTWTYLFKGYGGGPGGPAVTVPGG